MIDPSLPLHAALRAALIADATLQATVSGGVPVYDRVPAGAATPYIHVRSMTPVDDGNSCADAADVTVDIDVWSEAVGQVEAKTIGKAVVDVLDAPLDLDGFRCVVGHAVSAVYSTESDGLTTRGALSFRYLVDAEE